MARAARVTASCCCVTALLFPMTCLRLVADRGRADRDRAAGQGGAVARRVAALAAAIDAATTTRVALQGRRRPGRRGGQAARPLRAEVARVRDGAMLHDVARWPSERDPGQAGTAGRAVEDHARAPVIGERILRARPSWPRSRRSSVTSTSAGTGRLSRRLARRGDPDRQPDHPGLRRLRRDDRGPPYGSRGRTSRPSPSWSGPPARSSTRRHDAPCSTT